MEQALDLGYAERLPEGGYLIAWREMYDFIVDDETGVVDQGITSLMGLPSVFHPVAPALKETGSLADQFGLKVRGWVDSRTRSALAIEANPADGPVVTIDSIPGLFPKATWECLEEIRDWNSRPSELKTVGEARKTWARVRRCAMDAGATLSDYLRRTIVIDAATVDLAFEKGSSSGVVQVTPVIDGAPVEWLETFDSADRIRNVYRTRLNDSEYEVVLEDNVISVLGHLKENTSGRRHAAGARASSLLQNPYAVLGPHAHKVLDEDQVSKARTAWEADLHEFVFVEDAAGDRPAMLIRPTVAARGTQSLHRFSNFNQYAALIRELQLSRQAGVVVHRLEGKELLLDDLACQRIDTVLRSFPVDGMGTADGASASVAAARVLNLAEYADRVERIDQMTPFGVVRVPNAATVDWSGGLVDEVATEDSAIKRETPLVVEAVSTAEGESTFEPPLTLSARDVMELGTRIAAAKDEDSVELPQGRGEVPKQVAEAICSAGESFRTVSRDSEPKERVGLVEATNAERVTYAHTRLEDLTVPASRTALVPSSLRSEFRLLPHQEEGLAWLQHLWEKSAENHCSGAMLADDMGLGKTIQTLSLIVHAKETSAHLAPALVVAPVSLLTNWQEEAEKFFEAGSISPVVVDSRFRAEWRVKRPDLDPTLAGEGITSVFRSGWDEQGDLYLMNYETVRDFQFSVCLSDWSIAVFDEAQKIKNPSALVTRAAKVLKADFRIACTGTPVENSLTDLWCLFDTCVQPGLLGAANDFAAEYTKVIQGADEDFRRRKIDDLRRQIDPQVKRRLKVEVAKDLPAKIHDQACLCLQMSEPQEARYRQTLEAYAADPGMGPLHLLPRLATITSDFSLLDEDDRNYESAQELAEVNPKFAWLLGNLDTIRDCEERALIFVHLRSVQRHLRRHIQTRYGIDVDIINGDTSSDPTREDGRQQKIADFSSAPGFQVMILSPIAAGVGLNIQAANHVIHYMRHWNPAKEDQATDRAYRIGQTRPVTVYTPIVRGRGFRSFDEGLDDLLGKKRELARDMLEPSVEVGSGELMDALDLRAD